MLERAGRIDDAEACRFLRSALEVILPDTLEEFGALGLEPIGSVHAAGEEWSARTADGVTLPRGARIRTVAVEGLTLVVEPDPSSSESA